MNWLNKWFFKPARWYEFWRPQSGITGGVMMGTLISLLILGVLR